MENIELENLKQAKILSKNNLLKKEEEVQACKKNIIMLKTELQSIKDSRIERLSLKKLANKIAISENVLFGIVIAGSIVIGKNINIILGFANLSFMGLASHIGMVSVFDRIKEKRIEKDNIENNTDEIIEHKNKKLKHERIKYSGLKEEREKLSAIYEENKNNYFNKRNNYSINTEIEINSNEKTITESKPKTKIRKIEE